MSEALTDAVTEDQFRTMQTEAESYANSIWDCDVVYVSEYSEDAERFFDLEVSDDVVPSGLLANLQSRGFEISGIVSVENGIQITATPQ